MKECSIFLSPIVAVAVAVAVIFSVCMVFEDRRQARGERMFMRTMEIVEQGKLTDEEAKRIQEALQ